MTTFILLTNTQFEQRLAGAAHPCSAEGQWGYLKPGGWNYPKACSLTCLGVDAGSWWGPHPGQWLEYL